MKGNSNKAVPGVLFVCTPDFKEKRGYRVSPINKKLSY